MQVSLALRVKEKSQRIQRKLEKQRDKFYGANYSAPQTSYGSQRPFKYKDLSEYPETQRLDQP